MINKKDGVKNMPVKNKLNQSRIIDTLKKYKNEHEKDLGLIDLGIFGSVARQEIKTGQRHRRGNKIKDAGFICNVGN